MALRGRADALTVKLAGIRGATEAAKKAGLPRLFELEAEYEASQLADELKFVKALVKDMDEGTLEGLDMWRVFHSEGFNPEEVHFELNLDETTE